MQRFNDWLQDHQTAVAVLGPAGVALSAFGLRFAPGAGWIALCLVLLAIFAAAPSIAARVNRLQQSRRAAEHCIKEVLEACAYAMGHPGIHIRVNIMRFSSDRKRRKVHAATAFNMDRDPDYDLEMGVMAGVGGQAVSSRRPTIGDITLTPQAGGPDWGLSDAEKARVRPTLKSILGVPVFNPTDTSGDLLATLQIDSDLPLGESGLETEQKREIAQRFADVVSLLLEVSR